MIGSNKSLLFRIALAVWLIAAGACAVFAADEVDQMLSVESTAQKKTIPPSAKATGALPPTSAQPSVTSPSPDTTPLPAIPASGKKRDQVPAQAVSDAREPVQDVTASSKEAPAVQAAPAVTPVDGSADLLRQELMARELELAKANNEVERLKDIVKRIYEANKREVVALHYNKAAVYRTGSLYKKAEEEYLAALAIDPNDADVHYNLGILYDDNLKDKKKAKEHYQKFLELAPNDEDAAKVQEWLASIL